MGKFLQRIDYLYFMHSFEERLVELSSGTKTTQGLASIGKDANEVAFG